MGGHLGVRQLLKCGVQPRLTSVQRTLVVLEILMGVPAIGGGYWMATHPTTMMSLKYLANTPFVDWTWPGVFLFTFVGCIPLLVLVLQLMRSEFAVAGHIVVGLVMLTWIVVEAFWIVWFTPMQAPYFALGLAIVVLGMANAMAAGADATLRRLR